MNHDQLFHILETTIHLATKEARLLKDQDAHIEDIRRLHQIAHTAQGLAKYLFAREREWKYRLRK